MSKLYDLAAYLQEASLRPGVLGRAGWSNVVSFRGKCEQYFQLILDGLDLDARENEYGLIEPHIRAAMVKAQPFMLASYLAHAKQALVLGAKLEAHLVQEADSTDRETATVADVIVYFLHLHGLGLAGAKATAYIATHALPQALSDVPVAQLQRAYLTVTSGSPVITSGMSKLEAARHFVDEVPSAVTLSKVAVQQLPRAELVTAVSAQTGLKALATTVSDVTPKSAGAGDTLPVVLDKLGLTGEEAVQYIIDHGALLVKGMDAYTLKVMRSLIADGIENQRGVPGTMKLIRSEFKTMKTARARSIATTEMNDAMSEAALNKVKAVGLDGKRWIASPGACPLCQANKAQGIIPVEQAFQSGHQRPPGHPGKCRCAVAGARLSDRIAA